MGRNSDFYKEKEDKQLDKFNEAYHRLPFYTQSYLRSIKNNRQPATAMAYAWDLLAFFDYMVEYNPACKGLQTKDIPFSIMEQITARDIEEYQDYLRKSKDHSNRPKSISRKLTPLRGWYQHAVTYGDLKASPMVGVQLNTREDKSDILRLTNDEVSELFHKVHYTEVSSAHSRAYCEKTKERDIAIITTFLTTGIRVSELQGLDLSDLDFKNKRMEIVRKGGKSSFIYLTDDAIMVLEEYINGERAALAEGYPDEVAVFLSNRHSRMCVKAIENVVKKYTKEVKGSGKFTPHKLRSTYGTSLYRATSDIKLVADVLGHVDINTTSRHYAASEEEHRKQAAKINLYQPEDDEA